MNQLDFGGIATDVRSVDGLRIRYATSTGRGGTPLLLLSPWPESLFAFTRVWKPLSEQADLVAVDLPGFGHSEARAELFTPENMGDFVLHLIDEWELGRVHAVGPDIGTTVLLAAAHKSPDAFHSITVGSGGASYPLEVGSTLKDIIDAPGLEVFEAMPSRDIVEGALAGIESYAVPEDIREDYVSSYAGSRFAQSAQYVRTYPESLKALQPLLPTISTPTLIINGRKDPFVFPSNAEYLHDRLPNSRLALVDTGHFTWEDADEYAQLVTDWINGGYRDTPA